MVYDHIFFDVNDNLKTKTFNLLVAIHILLGLSIKYVPNIAFST